MTVPLSSVSCAGVAPDLGATWQLARRLGRGRALPLALLGDKLPAAEVTHFVTGSCVEGDHLVASNVYH